MFIMDYEDGKGWISPRIVPFQNLELSPAASVLHYGQALFEGCKAFRQEGGKVALFRPRFNIDRINSGCERLCIPQLPAEIAHQGLRKLVEIDEKWVPTFKGTSLYIRPTVIATEPFLGVRPAKQYTFFIITSPVGSYYANKSETIKIWIESEYVRAAQGGLGATKAAANYAASLMAAENAKARGYSQVLWLDAIHKKYAEEVGTMNVFFIFKDEAVTPPLSGTILNGSTREVAITLLKSWGHKVSERLISVDEIVSSAKNGELKEVFGTGTAAVICPVGEFGYKDTQISINQGRQGQKTQKLLGAIQDIQYGRAEDKWNWMESIT